MAIAIDENADLGAVQAELAEEKAALQERVYSCEREALRRRELKHTELVAQCRAASDDYATLTDEIETAQRDFYHLQSESVKTDRVVRTTRDDKPKSAYPSEGERAAWQKRIDVAILAASAARAAFEAAAIKCDGLQHRRRALAEANSRLFDSEKYAREELNYRRGELAKLAPGYKPPDRFVMHNAS